jgi:hypothetical protein
MIPLTRVPRELGKIVGDQVVPNYRRLYNAILDGAIDAYQKPNGRYCVDSDLTPILRHFNLEKAQY